MRSRGAQAELELQAEEAATLRLQLAQARAAAEQRAELARRCASASQFACASMMHATEQWGSARGFTWPGLVLGLDLGP